MSSPAALLYSPSQSQQPLSNDANILARLLHAFTLPDSNAIRSAELQMKPILKNVNCVPALMEVLSARCVQTDAVRQVSAVILRKRISSHYSKLPATYKTTFKSSLLNLVSSEPQRVVRISMVSVISTIVELEYAELEDSINNAVPWPEVLSCISSASQNSHEDARELAFLLLSEISVTVGTYMKDQFSGIAQLFGSVLQNKNEQSKVKRTAVTAVGKLLSFLAEEKEEVLTIFSSLIPNLLIVSTECRKCNDEETIQSVLDVLYDLSYTTVPSMTVHLSSIIQFCISCMTDPNLSLSLRDSAALVIATIAESKPKTFGKEECLLSSVIETLFQLIETSTDSAAGALLDSNPAWRDDFEDREYDDENDGATQTSIAQGTLDMLACHIPTKYIFPPTITRCLARLSSNLEHMRKAGVATVGVIAEGCQDPLKEQLSTIMPHVFHAAQDNSSTVRECACFALGQLSEHCQPDILEYSSTMLPILFQLLDDASASVQATSCYVLEMFCERLEPEAVRPVLDSLVKKLAYMLETTNKRSVQEMAVAALAATAVAAEEEFSPYVSGVANIMTKLMSLTDPNMYTLRGRSLECMGHVAIAVGKEIFREYFEVSMTCAWKGLTLESTDLNEFAYASFANLSKVMGNEFGIYLAELVPHLLAVITEDEGKLEVVKRENMASDFGNFDDSDDDSESNGGFVLNVRTAMLESKKGAITAIGEMAAHCNQTYIPYLEETMIALQKAAENWHPSIKEVTAEAFPSLVLCSVETHHGGAIEWTKGDITGVNPMSVHTDAITQAVTKELMKLMKEHDKEVVGKSCEAIQVVIEKCGPHALAYVVNDCLEQVHSILSKKAKCQETEEDGHNDDDDDHDSFMSSVCDLVASFARVMGSHFVQYLPQFLSELCKYAKPSRPASDRSMALGCLGELAQELEGRIIDHWATIFYPLILSGFADEDENIKRNAAFCVGICCEGLGKSIAAQYYMPILQGLSPMFEMNPNTSETTAACVDNAAAAVARMIITSPTHVPLEQVIPVFLSVLPLKNDMTENDAIYKCLLGLLQMKQSTLMVHKSQLRRIFMEATQETSKVDEDIKEKLKLALQHIPA